MIEEKENMNILETEAQTSKKFVFQVYPNNVEFVETLSYQEKNDLINYLLNDYKNYSVYKQKYSKDVDFIKKIVAVVLAIIVGVPLLVYLAGVSFELTNHSYENMQKNFEKLF